MKTHWQHILLICALLKSSPCFSKEDTDNSFYFYTGKPYGSESIISPLTVFLNEGFSILQVDNRSNRIDDIEFKNGLDNVFYNLSNPISSINRYGKWNFVKRELLPTSTGIDNAQYVPNYLLHLLGGGVTFREFREWYQWRDFSHPSVWAFFSSLSYTLFNEVVENDDTKGVNVDPIADVYIFDSLGVLLFSSDRVASFFSRTLQLRDWSFMPAYNPALNSVENAGQNFAVKYSLPFLQDWSIFYHFGMHGMLGLSHRLETGRSFSFGGGLRAKDLVEINHSNGTRSRTVSLVWTVGLFYDLNNSLMTSLILGGTKENSVRLNVYPGLLRIHRNLSPGFFINWRKDNQVLVGIHFSFFPAGLAQRLQ